MTREQLENLRKQLAEIHFAREDSITDISMVDDDTVAYNIQIGGKNAYGGEFIDAEADIEKHGEMYKVVKTWVYELI